MEVIEDNNTVSEAPKKKKTFTEKIDGFFNKLGKKKVTEPEEVKQEPVEQPQRSTTNERSERKATRRGEQVDIPKQTANLDEFIDITSSEASGNWMQGVYGMKLKLHNRSDETVGNAAVEVRYYNEHKELIEKSSKHH